MTVVDLKVVTSLDIQPEKVLRGALEAGLTDVVILGYDADGHEYFGSSMADGGDVLWHLERAKLKLLTQTSDDAPPRPANPEGKLLTLPKRGDRR